MEIVQERYFDLYNLAPVGYCTVNNQGLFLEVNLTAANMLGVAQGELAGQPISRFILKEDQYIYHLHRQNLFETGESQICELRLVKTGGPPFWTSLAATATQEADGTPSCRILISDITERKKAQEEKALLEIQLKKEQRMKSVGRLAGGVAHDFNNMLGVSLATRIWPCRSCSRGSPIITISSKSGKLLSDLLILSGNCWPLPANRLLHPRSST